MAGDHASSGGPGTAPDSAGRVRVLLPLPLAEAYDYRVPEGLALGPGDYVRVPLGNRELTGVVWGPATGQVAEAKLKRVIARHDLPPLPEVGRSFVDWVAAYVMRSEERRVGKEGVSTCR